MQCPQCHGEMESGELDLKASGIGALPQAQLAFNGELLLENRHMPVVGLFTQGTKTPAFRCRICQIICFQYGPLTLPLETVEPAAEASGQPA